MAGRRPESYVDGTQPRRVCASLSGLGILSQGHWEPWKGFKLGMIGVPGELLFVPRYLNVLGGERVRSPWKFVPGRLTDFSPTLPGTLGWGDGGTPSGWRGIPAERHSGELGDLKNLEPPGSPLPLSPSLPLFDTARELCCDIRLSWPRYCN